MTSYNDANFRLQFPAFQDAAKYPQAQVSVYWTMGTDYISQNNDLSAYYSAAQAQLANDLMCAHILYLMTNVLNGQPNGVVISAAEGSVNVGFMPPPVKSMFQYYLGQSPYGQQLLALLRAVASVGMYIGGSNERMGYRKISGIF